MALRLRLLRQISRALPQVISGNQYPQSRQEINLHAANLISFKVRAKVNRAFLGRGCSTQRVEKIVGQREPFGSCPNFPMTVCFRFSTVSESSHGFLKEIDLLSFIESAYDELEGPYHCWLNKANDCKEFCKRDGVFLVLAGAFLEDFLISGSDPVILFEKVKSLQQRYPTLQVMGFQSGSSISDAVRAQLLWIIMKEYVTFPILLSNKNFTEIREEACYIIFKGARSPLLYFKWDADLEIIDKAIKELGVQYNGNPRSVSNLKSTWVKQTEVIKGPHSCSSLQNILLSFPGCVSVDESSNRLFLSDINHHRIIVFDGNGRILDCIGSSPGFEDGVFESAKLFRPAASFYDAAEDCLYFVDSENHAIRRADMARRVLETLYPTSSASNRNHSLWSWIVDKFWMKGDVNMNSEDFNSESLLFPWHLMKSPNNDLFILNQSFETLWVIDLASGAVKEVVKGFSSILEICGQMILEKTSILDHLPHDLLHQQTGSGSSLEGIPYASLMSSISTFQDHIVFCDTVGQMVLKIRRETGTISTFHFSNFGILGLPYWFSASLEKVYAGADALVGVDTAYVQNFSLLPGRIDIKLNVDIPEDAELVEPLQKGSVWCQARGAAVEVSGAESKQASTEKVGVAQQWYDDLDSLAFSTPEVELSDGVEKKSDGNLQEGKLCIDCAVNTSPGTSEVVICAVLYLRLKRNSSLAEDRKEENAARIAAILNPRSGKMEKNACIQFLFKSSSDLGDLVFMKPLQVRLKFDCRDHPKAENLKDIVLTDSSIDVNISLN